MKLLQVTWTELLTLQLAHRSIPFTGRLNFAADFWLDERSAKDCEILELYNHVSHHQQLFKIESNNYFLDHYM